MKVWAKDGVIIQIGVCSGYRGTQQDCRQQERINSGLQGGNLAGAMGLEPAMKALSCLHRDRKSELRMPIR